MTKRATKQVTNPADQAQLRFYEDANSDKISESGLNFFWPNSVVANAGILGELNTAPVAVTPYRSILVSNVDVIVHYVALSKDPLMAVPLDGTMGVPIPPNGGSIILAVADNTYVRASSANVFGYLSNDSIIDLPDNP